jgi:hypothetical protein
MTGWNRWQDARRSVAAGVLALVAALMLYGVAAILAGSDGPPRVEPAGASAMRSGDLVGDHALYANVAARVARGEDYYAAAAAEHRANKYPLQPFITVRLPVLAHGFALLAERGMTLIVTCIGIAAILAWQRRLEHDPALPRYARLAALIMAANLSQIVFYDWALLHEVVAGALIALALALYRPERPWAAMAVLAVAVAVRETVLPVAVLLGCFALYDRDRRGIAAWLGFGMAAAGVLALHYVAVSAAVRADDLASPGWSGFGGWASYVAFVRDVSAFRFLPVWVSALLIPLALLGWASWRGRTGLAVLLVQIIYALVLMLFARPNNFYWAMLVVPTLFAGLIFAPSALAALWRSVRGEPLALTRGTT